MSGQAKRQQRKALGGGILPLSQAFPQPRIAFQFVMNPIYEFSENHIRQLHELYQQEWWTKGRTYSETEQGVSGSQVSIGLVDSLENLQGFARVITDFTFKALIFDVIVSEKQRGLELGKLLLELIQNHSDLKKVKHFELYCLPELLPFYEMHGFSSEVGGITLLRRINS